MSTKITITVACNGFLVEAAEGSQVFGTTANLMDWLSKELPKFPEQAVIQVERPKGEHHG